MGSRAVGKKNDTSVTIAQFVEVRVWPEGPSCPHCGGVERISRMQGKSYLPTILGESLMPKRKNPKKLEEQSAKFKRDTERLIEAGKQNPLRPTARRINLCAAGSSTAVRAG